MKKISLSKNAKIILNVAMFILVVVLIISLFLTAYRVRSQGFVTMPHEITLFEYLNYTSGWLIVSFILTILAVFLGVVIIVITTLEIIGIIKRPQTKDILSIVLIIVSTLAFAFTLIYCILNTPFDTNTDEVYLKYSPGIGMYFMLFSGYIAGILSLLDSPMLMGNDYIIMNTKNSRKNKIINDHEKINKSNDKQQITQKPKNKK